MKFLLIVLSIILFVINPLKASDIKIVYIDTDKVLNESMVGKNVKKQLDIINKRNTYKYEQISSLLLSKTSAFACNFSISFSLTDVVNSSNSFVSLKIFAASASS